MNQNRIHLSAIDCDCLQYVDSGKTYVCTLYCCELSDADYCMKCKRETQWKREEIIREQKRRESNG